MTAEPFILLIAVHAIGFGAFFLGRWSAKRRRTDHLYVRGPILGLRRTDHEQRL